MRTDIVAHRDASPSSALRAASPQGGEAHFREIDLGPEEAVPVGQGRSFVVGGAVVAVFRQRDGCLFAIDGRCPHRGGPLADGIVGDGKVVCPLHGWKIELATGRCVGEAETVRVHHVRRANGRIWLTLAEVDT